MDILKHIEFGKQVKKLDKQFVKDNITNMDKMRYVGKVLLALKYGDIGDINGSVTNYVNTVLNVEQTHYVNTYLASARDFTDELIQQIEEILLPYVDEGYDVLGQLYAGKDGKDLGIVLTPGYVTELMAHLMDIEDGDTVMDLCTGTGGLMIGANRVANINITSVELNKDLYATNLINGMLLGIDTKNLLSGDGLKTNIQEVTGLKPNKAILNPPYSMPQKGQEFTLAALDQLEPGGLAAVLIIESAGSGGSSEVNREIMKRHTLKTSISMPADLFNPAASVKTAIYILEAGTPHNFQNKVTFIDFTDDGLKRTARGIRETGNTYERYMNLITIVTLRGESHD